MTATEQLFYLNLTSDIKNGLKYVVSCYDLLNEITNPHSINFYMFNTDFPLSSKFPSIFHSFLSQTDIFP